MTIRERIENTLTQIQDDSKYGTVTAKLSSPHIEEIITVLEEFDARIKALEEREHMMIDLNVPFEVASKWRLEQGGHVCTHGDTGCTCARNLV